MSGVKKKNILIVDDSKVIQNQMLRFVKDLENVGEILIAENGQDAIDKTRQNHIDIITLDIQMPIKNGLEALPELLKISPNVKVIISSTLSVEGADITIKALALGACDYLTKPNVGNTGYTLNDFERDLKTKLNALLEDNVVVRQEQSVRPSNLKIPPLVNAVVIASSTGGPAALLEIFSGIGPIIQHPIFVVQHMPPIFTGILAENIQRISKVRTIEVQEAQFVNKNSIYIAPGGYHLVVKKKDQGIYVDLTSDPPEQYCRPSANQLFTSAANVYKENLLSIVLTGIGQDGLEGARSVAKAGGGIVVQDQQSSVVWGMPKAVYEAGLTQNILGLNEIKGLIKKVVG
jgi:two-component system, chemotaxis family, protein-glutamate methylesterase/glutaminase